MIPKIRQLSLASANDEIQLIQQLQDFHQHTGKKMEVYFDHAPPGHSRSQRFGSVTAHFIREGSTADAAIRRRLEVLGRAASTWTVVSSDRQIQAAARAAHARVISSENFAAELAQHNIEEIPGREKNAEISLSTEEVDEWLRLFGREQE